MRTITEIETDLTAAKEEYLETRGQVTEEEEYARGQDIKLLQKELSATITEGAGPCAKCGNHPIGVKHPTPAAPHVAYEIGCPVCKNVRARCASPLPRHAVELWNLL